MVNWDGMNGGGKATSSFAGEKEANAICTNGTRNKIAMGNNTKCQPLSLRLCCPLSLWTRAGALRDDPETSSKIVDIRFPLSFRAENTRRR